MNTFTSNMINDLQTGIGTKFSNIGEMFLFVKNIVGLNRYVLEDYCEDIGYFWEIHGFFEDVLDGKIVIEYSQNDYSITNVYHKRYSTTFYCFCTEIKENKEDLFIFAT